MAEAATAYDQVLYPSYCYEQTHPDRLATIATLYGMRPAPVARCRVLELGCGDGANLLPLALALPESRFTGIDLASVPIAKGQAMAQALELDNLTLICGSVTEITEDAGEFDYIIAHGLYSWVPPFVQEKILDICRANLAPQGVAYVSYNALPGWRLRRMVREMLLFHTRQASDANERITQARGLLNFLADAQSEPDAYQKYLRSYREKLAQRHLQSFFHDDLAEINEPLYFHQFMARAESAGLRYLAEADYFEMSDAILSPPDRGRLAQLAGDDPLRREQYLDFLKGRTFRQTLLCQADVRLDGEPQPESLRQLYATTMVRFVSVETGDGGRGVEEYRGEKGAALATDQPLGKATMAELTQAWPQPLSFADLLRRVRARLDADAPGLSLKPEEMARALGEILLMLYQSNLMELNTHPPVCAATPGERPVASPLARLQARTDTIVTSLRHAGVKLEDQLGRSLLTLLDGTRDRAALARDLTEMVVAGGGSLAQPDGQPITEREQIFALISAGLEAKLTELARLGLLVE